MRKVTLWTGMDRRHLSNVQKKAMVDGALRKLVKAQGKRSKFVIRLENEQKRLRRVIA